MRHQKIIFGIRFCTEISSLLLKHCPSNGECTAATPPLSIAPEEFSKPLIWNLETACWLIEFVGKSAHRKKFLASLIRCPLALQCLLEDATRPRERRETGEQDVFCSRLDQIIDMKYPLVTLGRTEDWRFLEESFGEVSTDNPGQPSLPTRSMAGLAILKHTYDLSGEVLCERRVETHCYQYFCGEEFF
jgi:hypothetical protein